MSPTFWKITKVETDRMVIIPHRIWDQIFRCHIWHWQKAFVEDTLLSTSWLSELDQTIHDCLISDSSWFGLNPVIFAALLLDSTTDRKTASFTRRDVWTFWQLGVKAKNDKCSLAPKRQEINWSEDYGRSTRKRSWMGIGNHSNSWSTALDLV